MATSKTQAKKLTIREYRSQVAALKKAGLISQSIDARSHKPTRHMKEQIKRFRHVLDGTAKVVKTPSRKIAAEFSGLRDAKFDRVIVRVQPGETARYSKTEKALVVNRKSNLPGIGKVREILRPREIGKLPKLPKPKKGKKFLYAIPFKQGDKIKRIFFDSEADLTSYMVEYEKSGFSAWKEYIEIVEAGATNERSKADKRQSDDSSGKKSTLARDEKGRFTKAEKGASPDSRKRKNTRATKRNKKASTTRGKSSKKAK